MRTPPRSQGVHHTGVDCVTPRVSGTRVSGWEFVFLRAPSLLIVQTRWSLASGPSLQSHTHARHAAPRARPPPRPGGKEMRRWDSEGGEQARMGGFSCAPRCPASLTFRDSPALLRQESDGYPVRPVALPRCRPPILPSSFPPRLRTPTSRPTLGLCPARPRPFCPSLTPRPDTHIQDKPGVCSQKK